MKTSTIPVSAPKWILIDAEGQQIGKVAVKAATILRGKHKATFSPHQNCGDHVVVINAAKLSISQKKMLRKTYHRHTGFPGNMKHMRLDAAMRRRPEFVVENAVKGMIEAHRLREMQLKRLHVFADDKHPYEAQKPEKISLLSPRKKS
jgi:large subunit ribosomal protein L13